MYMAAFPDLHFEVDDLISSGDKVVSRITCTGTHSGEFMGMEPTGKNVSVQAIDIIRFGDDNLAHEHWGVFDALAMMQQLGAIPTAAAV
jgi:predicted ester cyclase